MVSQSTDLFIQTPSVISTPPEEGYYFEGAEKLLEIWFSSTTLPSGSLRSIPRNQIDAMLSIARCKILHSKHNDFIDSYVLSESSLFVSDRRIIMKTCGTTHLLAALPVIIRLARQYAGLDQIQSLYYSRKHFMRPELQDGLHKNFETEVEYLNTFFENGHAHCFGSREQDRWYLYTYHETSSLKRKSEHTLEILMTDLNEEILHKFTKDFAVDGRDCFVRAGIKRIIPSGSEVHDELFDPCGYSMNAFTKDSDQYATIHVTPEKEFSFASFETNQDLECLHCQTDKVLKCFMPNKVLMTVFASDASTKGIYAQNQIWDKELPGYTRTDVQLIKLATETLVYAHFIRKSLPDIPSSSDEEDGDRSD